MIMKKWLKSLRNNSSSGVNQRISKENWRTNKNKHKIVREMKSKINLLEEAKDPMNISIKKRAKEMPSRNGFCILMRFVDLFVWSFFVEFFAVRRRLEPASSCALFLSLYGTFKFIKTKHENLSKAVDSTFLPCSGSHFSLFQHFSKVIPRHFMPRLPCAKIKQAQHEKERNSFKVELFFLRRVMRAIKA